MSIFSTLQTAVSGLAAQASKLGTIGDNIANQSTTGYKDADVEFSTMLGNSTGSTYNSGGVTGSVRYNISTAGTVTSTSTVTNLAISTASSGSSAGFFVVQTSSGSTAMTRAGAFTPDTTTGDLVNAAGDTLLGYSLTDGSYNAASDTGTLEKISTASTALGGETPSTTGTLSPNLPSTATAVSGTPSTSNYTEKTSMVGYDKLGNAVTLDVYMSKTSDNTWNVSVYNDADQTTALDSETLTFDPSSGALASGSTSSLNVTIPNSSSASATTVSIDMSGATQYAAAYDKGTQTLNGNAASKLSSVAIGTDGTVTFNYASGASNAVYKIPLATVTSPDQLTSVSGNNYVANANSGAMVLGTANAGVFGSIASSSLESSTVDLATELTDMISTQRAYEGDSKVMTTGSDMLKTLIQAIS